MFSAGEGMTHSGERRRAPRVELVGQLRGELVSVDRPIVIREISLGGMSIETSEPFEIESRHRFVLTLGDGAGVLVLGRVAYSRRIDRPQGAIFVTGLQFLDDDASDTGGDVGDLVNRIQ
jgi:hypothetical protein